MQDKSPSQESGSAFPPGSRYPSDEYTHSHLRSEETSPIRLTPSRRSESFPGVEGPYHSSPSTSGYSASQFWSNRPLRRSLPSGGSSHESTSSSENHPFVKQDFGSGNKLSAPSSRLTRKPPVRHISTLNITPMPPYLQEAEAVCSPTSHAMPPHSSSGRHMTSVNLELRSPASEQPPIEITTVPASVPYEGSSPSMTEFNSHVHISFSPTGTSVTAMRTAPRHLQSPSVPPEQTHYYKAPGFASSSSHYGAGTTVLQNNVSSSSRMAAEDGPGHASQYTRRGPDRKSVASGSRQIRSDDGYAEALLNYQKQKYDLLLQEVQARMEELSQTRLEVTLLEEEAVRELENSPFPVEEIQRLREEIRQLRIDCFILAMEVDLSGKGQVPLGETDEDFYKNIFTGPDGSMTPQANQSRRGSGTNNSQPGSFPTRSESPLVLSEEEENNEGNRWKCKHCTFLNHPALDKCELCDLPRVIEDSESGRSPHLSNEASSNRSSEEGIVGHVQISVRQNLGPSSQDFNRVRLRLTHKGDCSKEFTYSQRYYR